MLKLRTIVVCVLGSILWLSACDQKSFEPAPVQEKATQASEQFVIGFLPSQRATEIVPDAEKLASFLSARMGRPVKAVVPTAYEPLIEGLRFGHVQAAFLDGGPAWIAHKRSGAEVVLAEVKDGNTFYWAEAFVRQDSPITDTIGLKGKRAAFTSRTGSSGFIMPIGSLIADGLITVHEKSLAGLELGLQDFFTATVDAGGYEPALRALLDNRADVAFGAHDAPERFLDPEEQPQLRTLHRFGKIPSHAIVVAKEVGTSTRDAFIAAMRALNAPEHLPLLAAIYGVDGVTVTTTAAHLGDFGRALDQLPGMDRSLLNKVSK